ncbi:MAG: GGDEF domain-containing protein [Candidatus Sedimenticola sp. PURPLELP]
MRRPPIYLETDQTVLSERLGIARLFTFVGGFFALLFAISSLKAGNYNHAAVLLSLTILIAINLVYLRRSSNPLAPIRILAMAMAILFIHLVYTGGVGGSGILWVYIFPPLGYFLLGTREGTIAMVLVVAITALVILATGTPAYLQLFSTEFIQRLAASLTAVALLSYIYERSREKRHLEIIRLSVALKKQAGTDQLSGLLNRFSMTEILEHELERVKRLGQPFALVMGDIDLFKQINDSEGHLTGDKVIRDIAALIQSAIRKQDSAARWGGEEFLVFLPDTNTTGAKSTAERIRNEMQRLEQVGGRTITMSFGIAESNKDDREVDEIINRADKNLYLAKEQGRDCIVT